MTFRAVTLPANIPGQLWLDAMPGRYDSWQAFEVQAEHAGLTRVGCLTPRSEVAELSPAYHAAISQGELPFRWDLCAVPNYGLPQDAPAFRDFVHHIAQALRAGESVLLHCAAGIGRTGSTAACVLKALGLSADDALARIREAGSNPQNAQQTGLVHRF